MTVFGYERRRAGRLVLLALVVGGVLGFGLDSFGLLPVADVDVRWSVPALGASDYAPDASSSSGEETVLIYIGSSTCGWSNVPEFPSQIRRLKARMQAHARSDGKRFATLGIAVDRLASDGVAHLDKFGAFDEVMAGRSWANGGIQRYIYGTGDMGGPASTPQIVVLSRRLELPTGHVSIEEEHVILRKTGLEAILDWIAAGAPLSYDDI